MFVRTLAALPLVFVLATSASASPIVVPGTSNPWLAGMPAGLTSRFGDSAPGQSPAEVLLALTPGDVLLFSATGATDHCFGLCGLAGAEGDLVEPQPWSHNGGGENGIGDIIAPIDALLGVFLGPAQPSLTPEPGAVLDFGTLALRDFASLSPLLKQPFFIGDGLRNDGLTRQGFIVPTGATRLFLGTMDGFDWLNNAGSLDVSVTAVPEPTSLLLLGTGAAGLIAKARRRRKQHLQ